MTIARVALTGGIGSGKSTVAQIFAELGVPVVDLDQLGRSVVAPGSKGLDQLSETFGQEILNTDGSLNRTYLAQHCFADPAETDKLNAILHPLIRQAEDEWLKLQKGPYAIIEASVLLESGGAARMDFILVILADIELRRSRVLARSDRNSEQFDAIVARQCSDDQRINAADYILENSSVFDELRDKVIEVHRTILSQLKAE